MRRVRTAFTLFPFVLVAVLAVGLGVAGRLATHDAVVFGSPAPTLTVVTGTPTASAAPPPSATAAATTSPTPSPTPSPAPSSLANDAAERLRVHNDLRAAVGAPAVPAGQRVTVPAHRPPAYL